MKKRRGFTIIEVSLFLAVTATLFVGVIIGTQNSISRQRAADAVNGFVDFLKNVYSEVSNPQSSGKGNSDQAIYGRLISFGEQMGIGTDESGNTVANEGRRGIYVYDVLGKIDDSNASGDSLQTELASLDVTVYAEHETKSGSLTGKTLSLAGEVESYYPRWQSEIESVDGSDPIKAAILIVRHPRSGTINTLVFNTNLGINKATAEWGEKQCIMESGGTNCNLYTATYEVLKKHIKNFKAQQIDFCVDTFGDNASDRRNIRVIQNARNSAGVQLIDLDGDDNKCKK